MCFRGFQAYLNGAPNYNFPMYRQLVHEITQTFSKISQDIIFIINELEEKHHLTSVSSIVTGIQNNEKDKLEKVTHNDWGKHFVMNNGYCDIFNTGCMVQIINTFLCNFKGEKLVHSEFL